MQANQFSLGPTGLGLRREMLEDMLNNYPSGVDFLEVAPENWMNLHGSYGKQFKKLTNKINVICHGLSLSLGSPEPLDMKFLKDLKEFFNEHNIIQYSEHLSYCSGAGHMYDLMPIPFTEQSAKYVIDRIKQVQDALEMTLIIENVSYYAAPGQQMPEIEFTNKILEGADCKLLLDVNNIYVNSINHNYDATEFLAALPSERIAYGHIAGHYNEADDLIIDTHGADVIEDVWSLLAEAYHYHGVFPTLLERDFNIPPMEVLLREVSRISSIQSAALKELKHA